MEHVNDVLACGIYNVSIVVDGEKVPQYGLEYEESEEGPKASCWIPSTAGKVRHKSSFSLQIFYPRRTLQMLVS